MMNSFQKLAAMVACLLILAVAASRSPAADKPAKPADDDPLKLKGTRHSANARVIYPNRPLDPSIQAELQPGPFTIPEGYKAIDLKFRWHDQKMDLDSEVLRPGHIKCVKSKRPPRKSDFKPGQELAAGEYLLIVGGFPEAVGTLSYTLVPDNDTDPTPSDKSGNPAPDDKHGSPTPSDKSNNSTQQEKSPDPATDTGLPWIYQGVWLPERYFPAGYRHYPDERMPAGDPALGNGSQSIWRGIPLQRKGGKPSSSAGEHPYTVYIDGITVYKSIATAKRHLPLIQESLTARTSVALGDEAYIGDSCKGDDGSIFKEFTGKDGVYCRQINVWLVRVGRVTFGLRVAGDRVKDFNPNGQNHRDFIAHETPSREDVMRVARMFVDGVRAYSKDKGWLED